MEINMRFDIEGFVTFDTEDASLVNIITGDCIELSQTSNRLLTELLHHRSDILSRGEIFQSVFDKYGARASNSNLNQYISTLRKNMSHLGIQKNIIITVPRIGFKIAEDAIITCDQEYNSFFTPTPIKQEKTEKTNSWLRPIPISATIITLLFLLLTVIIKLADNNKEVEIKKFTKESCIIFIPSNLPFNDVMNNERLGHLSLDKLDCSSKKKLYIYKKQRNSVLGTNIQIFITECDEEKKRCTSHYYREKKNA